MYAGRTWGRKKELSSRVIWTEDKRRSLERGVGVLFRDCKGFEGETREV